MRGEFGEVWKVAWKAGKRLERCMEDYGRCRRLFGSYDGGGGGDSVLVVMKVKWGNMKEDE